MKTSPASSVRVSRSSLGIQSSRLAALLGLAALALGSMPQLAAQAPGAGSEDRRRGERGSDRGGDRGNFNPQEMQARMLNSLRERLEITDDEEWKVISERVAKVSELRRNSMGGMMGMMGGRGGPPGGGDRGGSRGPGGNNPEMAALGFAIRDKLPDAEVKTRLERLRESRKESEAKVTKAQEDLRAVLSVRQEAIAVMFGLLP